MPRTVAIDFETDYSKDYSIKTLGSWGYIHDPRFNAYMVSVVSDDGTEWVGNPKDFDWNSIDGDIWLSHNASFDETVYRRLQGIHGFTAEPSNWYCTSNMSSYFQGPRSLAGASKQMLGTFVDKSVRDKQAGKDQSEATDDEKAELDQYALDDSRLCLQLWQKYGDKFPEWERRLGRLTYQWGTRGVQLDVPKLEQDISALQKQLTDAVNLLPWAKAGTGKPLSRAALAQECMKCDIPVPASLAMDNPEAQRWEDRYADKYPWVDGVRTFRRVNRLLKVCETLHDRVDDDGIFHYGLKYYAAAQTGRWGGSDGLNMQNLPRGEMFGVDVRKTFRARPGHKFIICDLSQIEVRCLADLAGNTRYLDLIRGGLNPYEAAAALLLGMENTKGLKKRDGDTYAMVKAMVLGCGYGMQGPTFQKSAPMLTGFKYVPSRAEATRAVATYRQHNPEVIRLWNAMGKFLKESARKGEDATLELPSLRKIHYFQPCVLGRNYTAAVQMGGTRKHFFGAKVVENACQGYARDVFGDCLLRIQDSGLPGNIVWHVHDEVIYEAPEDQAKEIAKEIQRIMSTPPEWAADLPLYAEYVISDRYCK